MAFAAVTLIVTFLIVFGIGWAVSKWVSSVSDFFVAGREIGPLLGGALFAAIWISGATTSAVPQLVITHGFWIGFLYLFSFAYGLVFFGWLGAPILRKTGIYTIPEFFAIRYGETARLVATIGQVFVMMGMAFPQVLGPGLILTSLTGLPVPITTLIITLICWSYVVLGGIWSAAVTDLVELLVAGMGILTGLIIAWQKYPLPSVLASLPGAEWRLSLVGKGGWSLVYPGIPTLLILWAIAVWGANYYWTSVVSQRNVKSIRTSTLLGAITVTIVMGLFTTTVGLYALTIDPKAAVANPGGAFGIFMKVLPSWVGAVIFAAILSAAMSTADIEYVSFSSLLVRDIYQRYMNPKATAKQLVLPSRIVITLVMFAGWFAVQTFWSYGAGFFLAWGAAFAGPTFVCLLLGLTWPGTTPKAAALGLLGGIGVTLYWQMSGLANTTAHIVWPALITPAIVVPIVSLFSRPKYYGERGFVPGKAMRGFEKSALSPAEVTALDLINRGKNSQTDLVDALEMSSVDVNSLVEGLEKAGLVKRQKYTWTGLFTFELTSAGESAAPAMDSEEASLWNDWNASFEDIRFLGLVGEGSKQTITSLAERMGVSPGRATVVADYCREKGWVEERGLIRRSFALTETGRAMAKNLKPSVA